MGQPTDYVQNNMTAGELSPLAEGRWDINKYVNSVKTMENWLIKQLGGAVYSPGTRFVAETKVQADRARLLKFLYSTEQNYAVEAGDEYFRYYANGGQLVDGSNDPVETVTPFEISNIRKIKYTQSADTQYITTGVYPVQKHTRTSAISFSMTEVLFKRGPFLDTNISAITITPSSATGSTILTASSAIFLAGHVGSLWRVGSAVVKITIFTDTTHVTGTVQAEPDGAAGNIGSTSATSDWAEGAWSAVRGYPKACVFHDGRLWLANTDHQVGGLWGSVPFEYENFDSGDGDDGDAIKRELSAGGSGVPDIRWLSSGPKNLQAGTSAGPFTISSGNQGIAITPSNVTASQDNEFGTADIQARRMFNYGYYAQNNLKRIIESGYFFDVDQNDVQDATLLADHILEPMPDDTNIFLRGDDSTGGVFDMDTQQSPNNRLWVIRDDGQIAVLTRNPRQEINGWARRTAGKTISCDGKSGTGQFESIVILPQEGAPDVIWVIVNRLISGEEKRFVEYFTDEDFKYDWDAVRLDCSLTLNDPINIEEIIFLDDDIAIKATAHGLGAGDQIRIDNIVGTNQLNGKEFIVNQSFTDYFTLMEIT
jgi:hypothetical protein